MIQRLTISLTAEEGEGLQKLAAQDFRPPKDEMRWVLREELRRRGFLEPRQELDVRNPLGPEGREAQ